MQQRIQRRRQLGWLLSHGGNRAHLLALGIALLLGSAACTKDGEETAAAAPAADDARAEGPGEAELVYREVPGTPLKIKVPADWALDDVDPGPEPKSPAAADGGPAVPAKGTALALRSRTMLSARAPDSKVNKKLAAWLMVLHDPYLPLGTTSTAYLDAERASNQQALPSLKHVEAERSRRQGRPAYYVRDEWSAPLTAEETLTFSQETLLLLDAAGDYLHGYSITITLPKKDRPDLEKVLREVMESVRFQKQKKK